MGEGDSFGYTCSFLEACSSTLKDISRNESFAHLLIFSKLYTKNCAKWIYCGASLQMNRHLIRYVPCVWHRVASSCCILHMQCNIGTAHWSEGQRCKALHNKDVSLIPSSEMCRWCASWQPCARFLDMDAMMMMMSCLQTFWLIFNWRQDSSHHHHKTWSCEALDWKTKLKLFVCRYFFDASIALEKYYRIFPASSLNICKLFTFHQALLIIITCTVNATASQHCQLILMYENATSVLSPPLLFSFWKGTSQLIQASPRSP